MKGKIFNTQKVQSMIAGNMTMFREVIKYKKPLMREYKSLADQLAWEMRFGENRRPYKVGQKIFCKESFCLDPRGGILYKTLLLTHDLPKEYAPQWKPAQDMKQEHSRLTLQIKEIRVERLQDISKEDIIKEGFKPDERGYLPDRMGRIHMNPWIAFKIFWNATHKKPEEKFEANPWVWKIKFEVVK
jgi:hypothetical protein